MRFKHNDHEHTVYLLDDGTLDTVIEVDGLAQRYSSDFEPDVHCKDTKLATEAIVRLAEDTCNAGLLEGDTQDS